MSDRTKTPECCAACGAPTAYSPGAYGPGDIAGWWNRICGTCRQATWDSYLGPVDEKTYQYAPAAGPLPGAPWTPALVEQAARYRLLDAGGSLHYVWPEQAPLTTVSVWCSQAAYHLKRGPSCVMVVARGLMWPADYSARWFEDVTPSAAQVAQWLNKPNPNLTLADRHDNIGGTIIGGRKAFAIRTTGGWAIEVGPARGGWALDLPGRNRHPALMGQARIRYKLPEMLGLVPDQDGSYDLSYLPGRIELRCGCGLAWCRGEDRYSAAFDKLAAAGIDRVELLDLTRFA